MRIFRRLAAVVVGLWLTLSPTPANAAPEREPAFSRPVVRLNALRMSTLARELTAAGRAGYRVWVWQPPLRALLVRSGDAAPIEYAMVSGNTAQEFEAALTRGGAKGYRVVPRTFTMRLPRRTEGAMESTLTVIVERVPGETAEFSYRVETVVTDGAREPVNGAVGALGDAGFDIVALGSLEVRREEDNVQDVYEQMIFVGERRAVAKPAISEANRYRVLPGAFGPSLEARNDGYVPVLYGPVLSVSAYPGHWVLLERQPGDPATVVLAGGWSAYSLLLQVTRAAALGCRVLPDFEFASAVLMRCASAATTVWQYRVFEDEGVDVLGEAVAAGWMPVSVSSDARMVLMERAGTQPVSISDGPARAALSSVATEERVIRFVRLATAEKEVARAADEGFMVRPSFVEASFQSVRMVRVPDGERKRAAMVLSDRNDDKLEAALNQAALQGFRVVPGVQFPVISATRETVVIMEKVIGELPTPVRYRVIGAARRSTFDAELAAARVEGDTIVAMLGSASPRALGGRVAVLEQPLR